MARPKQDLTNIFAKTAPTEPGELQPEKANKPLSVYLSNHDRTRLEAAAAALGVSRHSLIQYAVLYLLAGYERGDIKPALQQQNTLRPPK